MAKSMGDYGFIRVGAAAPELRVADVDFNTVNIIELIDLAVRKGCHFLLFPELCLTGYTCGDLFYQKQLLDSALSAIETISLHTGKTKSVVILGAPIQSDGMLFNCAVVISQGTIAGIVPKTYLCNTNEYYEERWFSSELDRKSDSVNINGKEIPFGSDLLFQVGENSDHIFGIELCEDLWSVFPPSFYQAVGGATLMLNLSASSETLGKNKYRRELVASQSARCLSAYVYASSGPGESSTDLVFPGHCIIAEYGTILSESSRYNFNNQLIISDIDIERVNSERIRNNSFASNIALKKFRRLTVSMPMLTDKELCRNISPTPFIPFDEKERTENCREIFTIQATGLAKRLKHLGMKDVVIGVSGGLDSTLALLVCLKSFSILGLDRKGIHAVSMPGYGTTVRTSSNSQKLSELLRVTFSIIDIKNSVEVHFADIGHDPEKHDIVFENSQARERTQILMDYANKVDGIVIGTGDLSELALGWSTYNGDQMSMYGVNSGVPKTLIRYVIQWCSEVEFTGEAAGVLKDIVDTPISPELLPAGTDGSILQKTESDIGPYLLHDFFLFYMVRFGFSPGKILFLAERAFKDEFKKEEIKKWLKLFYKRFYANQFKRSCLPDGVKVGSVALSPRGDWRMPSDASSNIWTKDFDF